MQYSPHKSSLPDNIYEWLMLSLTPRVGPVTLLKLIKHFGSPQQILSLDFKTLSQVLNPAIAKLIVDKQSAQNVEKTLAWEKSHPSHQLVTIESPLYPRELAEISDPPLILYLKGNIQLLQNRKLAIVGTRHPTSQGIENAKRFAYELANNKLTIVSGMANGIDRHAHIGALKGYASTIGVLGTGIDTIYPLANKELYGHMSTHGLLLSEFPIGTQPSVGNFPRRNRIISGLALGCLVIESAIDGGSLISANLALEMGRDVMAIPGSIHNPVAKGCHKLIKQGAKLIENTHDVLEELGIVPQTMPNKINQIEDKILNAMGFEPITIDKICSNLNLEFDNICAKLLELELEGHIINCGGSQYQRIFK